jgi:hypothetical protein
MKALAGRIAVRRAGRGEEYGPMAGELWKMSNDFILFALHTCHTSSPL